MSGVDKQVEPPFQNDASSGPDKATEEPVRLTMISGVPRSGTSVLHALACTDESVNPYIGEASHLRLLVQAYRQSRALFEPHTQYFFHSKDDHQAFHQEIIALAVRHYASVLGDPSRVVLKDPLLMKNLADLADLVPGVRLVIILRHPCDVLASRLTVQDKAGVPRSLDRLIAEHNDMLTALLNEWDRIKPHIVTYPMLTGKNFNRLRIALAQDELQPENIWQRDIKRFETDMQEQWKTPLYGKPLKTNNRSRRALDDTTRGKVFDTCMPLCHKVLRAGGMSVDTAPYWTTN